MSPASPKDGRAPPDSAGHHPPHCDRARNLSDNRLLNRLRSRRQRRNNHLLTPFPTDELPPWSPGSAPRLARQSPAARLYGFRTISRRPARWLIDISVISKTQAAGLRRSRVICDHADREWQGASIAGTYWRDRGRRAGARPQALHRSRPICNHADREWTDCATSNPFTRSISPSLWSSGARPQLSPDPPT